MKETILFITVLILLLLFSGCNSNKLPDCYNETLELQKQIGINQELKTQVNTLTTQQTSHDKQIEVFKERIEGLENNLTNCGQPSHQTDVIAYVTRIKSLENRLEELNNTDRVMELEDNLTNCKLHLRECNDSLTNITQILNR